MSRVYAIEEHTGRRFLFRIDFDYCDASIKPHPDIAKSGWTQRGNFENGIHYTWDCCPDHS